jgi:hypothetical protein
MGEENPCYIKSGATSWGSLLLLLATLQDVGFKSVKYAPLTTFTNHQAKLEDNSNSSWQAPTLHPEYELPIPVQFPFNVIAEK